MPQEIRVLCCFKCKRYQVDIVKKTNKWQCKLCSEKQSVFKEFFRGTGIECRQKVQELNLTGSISKYEEENEFLDLLEQKDLELDLEYLHTVEQSHTNKQKSTESKWAKYVDDSNENRPSYISNKQCIGTKRKSTCNSEDTVNVKCSKNNLASGSKWSAYL